MRTIELVCLFSELTIPVSFGQFLSRETYDENTQKYCSQEYKRCTALFMFVR